VLIEHFGLHEELQLSLRYNIGRTTFAIVKRRRKLRILAKRRSGSIDRIRNTELPDDQPMPTSMIFLWIPSRIERLLGDKRIGELTAEEYVDMVRQMR